MPFWSRASARWDADKFNDVQVAIAELAAKFDALSVKVDNAVARPRGFELLRKLGVTPARFVEQYFETRPDNELYEALFGGSESIRGTPSVLGLSSSLCRQLHFSTDEFRFWMHAMGPIPRMHRKEWEWFYIAQALFDRNLLNPGRKGLGFAVGEEPLPSLFAAYGCDVVATDQAPEQAASSGWASWGMYAASLDTIFYPNICSRTEFDQRVSYENADMNDISAHFEGRFDFCWSSCAFEHLGSLEHGIAFVERSLDTLVPGGLAVHTTEYNLSSNDATMETPGCSIFRKQDIFRLVDRLQAAGHKVEPIDLTDGRGFAETVIDLPPYRVSPHLKLQVASFTCTSIGLIVQKAA